MIDRNKVMQALKCCSDLSGKSCAKCTYVTDDFCLGNGSPIGQLAHDALELMKEQEAIVRCKDCLRRGTYDCPVYIGGDGMCSEPDDWFCADGERR